MSPRTRAFFAEVTALHRWFGLSNASRDLARAVKGATMLLFLFLLFSGAYLWLPRTYTWSALRVGVGLPLAEIALTGTVMAYPWANALLFRAAGSPVPVRSERRAGSSRQTRPLPAHLD